MPFALPFALPLVKTLGVEVPLTPLMVFGADFGGLYDLAYGESGAWKSVGAEGLMERASSMRPSVKMSAAKRSTV